jgi:hypothetical protein
VISVRSNITVAQTKHEIHLIRAVLIVQVPRGLIRLLSRTRFWDNLRVADHSPGNCRMSYNDIRF